MLPTEYQPLSAPLSGKDTRSGIYAIWMPDDPKGRVYVGQAVCVRKRIAEHRAGLRKGAHHTVHLQRTYTANTEAAFVWALVEEVGVDRTLLTLQEQAWMDRFPGRLFNAAPAAGSNIGYRHSDATKAKLSAALRGRTLSQEHCESIRQSRIGKSHSPERIAAMAAGRAGIRHTPEAKAKMSAAHRGVPKPPCSEARKKALSDARRGVPWSTERIAQAAAAKAERLAARTPEEVQADIDLVEARRGIKRVRALARWHAHKHEQKNKKGALADALQG